jgi:hypothetical protein
MDLNDDNAQLRAKVAALETALDAEKAARVEDKKRSVALKQLQNNMVALNDFLKERLFIKKYCTRSSWSCVQSALIFSIPQ